jgi:sulfur-carrier protein
MNVKLLYFAWVREKVGKPEETIELPDHLTTISDLLAWLSSRGSEYAAAFERSDVIRAAIDRAHVKPSARLEGASEIAFFPPVTGG